MRAHPAQAPAPVPDPAGTAQTSLLKRYRPLETRATGGFGTVEICLDSRLQRRVAIKRIPLAANSEGIPAQTTASALAEARTASMLQHPNIVAMHDFTYDIAYAYLVMEYVDGMSLEEFLAQVEGNSLTYDEAACIADALSQALAFAHENGVLHLDIKPANVLIDRSGHVKLTDFGMASLASAAGFGGARGGTIGYMPPEQLEGIAVDERSDIFALASVLYESLCGAQPFRAGTPAESQKLIERGVTAPGELLPDIPQTTENALLAALSPDPANRPRSATAFGDEFLQGLGNPRDGRRSLARIIEHLTSDDTADGGPAADEAEPQRTWELDPAEGRLGSQFPRARGIVRGVVAGAALALTCLAFFALASGMLGDALAASPSLGLALANVAAGNVAWLLASLAVGVACGFAPQIGGALTALLVCALMFDPAELVATLPVTVLLAALGAGWWLTWGRTCPGAAACYPAVLAAGVIAGSPAAALPVLAYLAYDAAPAAAAATGFLGLFSSVLVCALPGAGAGLAAANALAACADPVLWAELAGLSALAGAESQLLQKAWQRYQDNGSTSTFVLCYALPALACVLAALAVAASANPMEITSVSAPQVARAAGAGIVSSIIVWICAFALGYRKELSEGDCQ